MQILNKRIILILVIVSLFAIGKIAAQTQNERKDIRSLQVGDAVPDFKIAKIFNGPKKTAMMSDFKDQLVIFDFGGTTCSSCILALPHMQQMEQQFAGKLRIFWVTPEPEAVIRSFWGRNKYTRNNKIQTIVEDDILNTYFKHLSVPYEAWVYKGKVIALTLAEYVTPENIRKVLNGEKINWPVQNELFTFDPAKQPLFALDPNQADTANTPVQYAAISDYRSDLKAFPGYGILRDKRKKTIRSYFPNSSVQQIYQLCWMNLNKMGVLVKPSIVPFPYFSNEILWEVSNRSRYIYDPKSGFEADWNRANAICFESLKLDSGQTDQQVYQSVIADMNALLGLNVRWEKRKEKVLVLVRTTSTDQLKTRNPIPREYTGLDLGQLKEQAEANAKKHINQKGSLYQYRDVALDIITAKLNGQENNPYVFDETKYMQNVDMDLNIPSWTDIAAIRKALSAYGLDLKEEERLVDRFVFTEINGGMLVNGEMKAAKAKRDTQAGMANPATDDNKTFLEANKKKTGVVTLPSGLQYKILKEGKGLKPGINDKVSVNYLGTLVNGKIFDSSYESGRPVLLSLKDIIPGWAEALKLMPVGSKWEIYIPATLAYADHTGQGTVPPNSTLIFEIELLDIVK